jgi:hypothetical protein
MSGYNVKELSTFKANIDLSALQFRIMKGVNMSGELGITTATAATDELLGVLQDKPIANDFCGVATRARGGRCQVIAGGTVTAGDKLTTDATGRAITTVTATNKVLGIAAKSGVVNEIIEVDLGEGPDVI